VKYIGVPALVAAIIGPFQSVLGWVISQSLWPEYDPIKKTISDLAANDSPTQAIMTAFFIFGATLTIIGAIYAHAFALPGRIVLVLAGLATYALAYWTTPSQIGFSVEHRISASIAFLLFSLWPIFAMRRNKSYPKILQPRFAIGATVIMLAVSIWFLSTWTDPEASITGIAERVVVTLQTLTVSFFVIFCWFAGRKGNAVPSKSAT
jgi:hypothetical membrane protein